MYDIEPSTDLQTWTAFTFRQSFGSGEEDLRKRAEVMPPLDCFKQGMGAELKNEGCCSNRVYCYLNL